MGMLDGKVEGNQPGIRLVRASWPIRGADLARRHQRAPKPAIPCALRNAPGPQPRRHPVASKGALFHLRPAVAS